MSEICGIIDGLNCPTCEDLQAKAGLVKNIYIGSHADLDQDAPFTYDVDGRIEAINLDYQKYLYKFCAKDRSANYNQTMITGDNGIKVYQQTVNGMFQQQGQVVKNIIDGLKEVRDLFVVVETNYGTFEVLFVEMGGEATQIDKASGLIVTDANSWVISIAHVDGGESKSMPDFLDTDYATTKQLLESYLQ
jgi:hypothetical protein